jgi:hypothetical protein
MLNQGCEMDKLTDEELKKAMALSEYYYGVEGDTS